MELDDPCAHMPAKFLSRLPGGLPPWVAFVTIPRIGSGSYRDGSAGSNIHADRRPFEWVGDGGGGRTGRSGASTAVAG